MSPFCCARLFTHCSFGSCVFFLAKVAMAAEVAVFVVGGIVFFGSDCLVVVLEAVDLTMVGLRYHGLFGEGSDGVLLLLAVLACLDASSIS